MSDAVTNAPIAGAVKLTNGLDTFGVYSSQRFIHITVILPDTHCTVSVPHSERRCVIRSRSVTQSARFSFCLSFGSRRKNMDPVFLFPHCERCRSCGKSSSLSPSIIKFKSDVEVAPTRPPTSSRIPALSGARPSWSLKQSL